MQKSEVAMLLVFKHSIEGGEVVESEVEAWFPIIKDLPYADALEAAREHYRTESRLFPRDLVEACAVEVRSSSYAGNVTEQRLAAEASRRAEVTA